MDLFVGLDVSIRMTSVCVMDLNGKGLNEAKVDSEPQAMASLLGSLAGQYRRVGLEAGSLSQWLYSSLAAAGVSHHLRRNAAHEGGAAGANQQNGQERRARHRADDARWPVSPRARQDRAEPRNQDVADGAQIPAADDD